jgi:hypothetical protein
MAIQTGNIRYRGSFKNIRQYRNLHDPNTYAGEKGGANRDLIMNSPAFARTRENMNEFSGCGLAVKAIRQGLVDLLPEQTDKNFTARMMKVVKEINCRDLAGFRGKRAILFSEERPFLSTFKFNTLENYSESLRNQFTFEHPITRGEATLTVADLALKQTSIPKGASHFRIQNHLSIIADYTYSEANRRYEPMSPLDKMSAHIYSEYTPIGTLLTDDLVAAFPVGTVPGDSDSVIQCVGIEFYVKDGPTGYLPLKGGSMLVLEVF